MATMGLINSLTSRLRHFYERRFVDRLPYATKGPQRPASRGKRFFTRSEHPIRP